MNFRRVVFSVLVALFVVCFAASFVARSGFGFAFCAVEFALLCAAFVFERRRYSGSLGEYDPAAVRTGETFRDPVSGAITDVYVDEASGRRAYRVRNG